MFSAKHSKTTLTVLWLLIALLCAGSFLAAGCRQPLNGGQAGLTTDSALTTPQMRNTSLPLLILPDGFPIEQEEADTAASTLDIPLEVYDSLRPGGAADLQKLEKVTIDRVVDGDTFMVARGGEQ
ncbi:MAG TPA: hypothetical protein PKH23_07330, partial [Bacillota bacterium]|nr:hypothetical protein [Bacillota bacterium]